MTFPTPACRVLRDSSSILHGGYLTVRTCPAPSRQRASAYERSRAWQRMRAEAGSVLRDAALFGVAVIGAVPVVFAIVVLLCR